MKTPRPPKVTTSQGRRIGVIDTDALMNDLKARVRGSALDSVFTSRLGGRPAPWYASTHVLIEMYQEDPLFFPDKFHKLCAQSMEQGWPTHAATFRQVFEAEYLRSIRFVDVTGVLMDSHMALAVATFDAKDKPTGQLAALLALTECVVYSHDRDLRRPRIAPPDLSPVLAAVKALELAGAVPQSIEFTGTLTALSMNAAVEAAARHLGLPKLAGWSLIAVLTAWVVADPARRAKVGKGLGVAVAAVSEVLLAGEAAKAELASAAIDAFESPPLECHIAAVLATCSGPMTVPAIRRTMLEQRRPNPPPSETKIRETVRAMPCFVEVTRHHWQLGATMLPTRASEC
ncbi:MAG: hypothetical protein HY828_03475 [Actinobacteria bacterium]|nr:hypothetical protein [Actinomycetota bacterium]